MAKVRGRQSAVKSLQRREIGAPAASPEKEVSLAETAYRVTGRKVKEQKDFTVAVARPPQPCRFLKRT